MEWLTSLYFSTNFQCDEYSFCTIHHYVNLYELLSHIRCSNDFNTRPNIKNLKNVIVCHSTLCVISLCEIFIAFFSSSRSQYGVEGFRLYKILRDVSTKDEF